MDAISTNGVAVRLPDRCLHVSRAEKLLGRRHVEPSSARGVKHGFAIRGATTDLEMEIVQGIHVLLRFSEAAGPQ